MPGVRGIADIAEAPQESNVWRIRLEAAAGDVSESVFGAVAAAGLTLRELRREQTSLEDVFASLTTRDAATEPSEGARESTPSQGAAS